MSANPAGVKVKAAAWGPGGRLYAVVERSGKRATLVLEGGRVVAEQPAAPQASRVVVLPSGAVLTMARDGKGKLVPPDGTPRATHLSLGLEHLEVCQGVAYAGGRRRQLNRFDAVKANWSSAGLRAASVAVLPEVPGAQDDVVAITAGKAGPLVALHANSAQRMLVMEFDGTAWAARGFLPSRVNALAWKPEGDVVYAVGETVFALDAQGLVTELPEAADRGFCSAGFARGELLAGTLRGVSALDLATGAPSVRMPAAAGEVPVPHSLATSGEHAAFVCEGKLWVLQVARFVAVALE